MIQFFKTGTSQKVLMYLEVFLGTERKTERFRYDLKEKIKFSEIFEFSILLYTQNQKLGNLGKFSFKSNFDSLKSKRMHYGSKRKKLKLPRFPRF